MRVRITFQVNNRGALVPFHHQYLIAQVFKDVLETEAKGAFADYPFYSFSGLKGQTRLGKRGLHYNSRRVTIVVSSASSEFVESLVQSVLRVPAVNIGELNITPEMAEEELPVELDRGTKYICISPLVIRPVEEGDDQHKQFFEPSSNEFSDFLYDSTVHRMAGYGIDTSTIPDVQKFQLVPDEAYLNKLRASNKKFSRIYPLYRDGIEHEIRGYTFPFTLFAAPEVQDFIFTCGLGIHCSNGFGMLDLANSDPIGRTVPYQSGGGLIPA